MLGWWFELPEKRSQRTEFLLQLQGLAGIAQYGLDLASVTNDARITAQPLYISGSEGRYGRYVETVESMTESVPSVQDGAPAEAGLKAFQADFLEKQGILGDRHTPFKIVVALEQRVSCRYGTS